MGYLDIIYHLGLYFIVRFSRWGELSRNGYHFWVAIPDRRLDPRLVPKARNPGHLKHETAFMVINADFY